MLFKFLLTSKTQYASSIFLGVSISTSSYNLHSSLLSLVIVLVSKSFSLFHFYTFPTLDVKYLKTPIYLQGSLKNNFFSSEMYHAKDFVCLAKRIVMSHTTPMRGKTPLGNHSYLKVSDREKLVTTVCHKYHSFVQHYLMLFLII